GVDAGAARKQEIEQHELQILQLARLGDAAAEAGLAVELRLRSDRPHDRAQSLVEDRVVVDEQDVHGKENPTPESGVLEPTGSRVRVSFERIVNYVSVRAAPQPPAACTCRRRGWCEGHRPWLSAAAFLARSLLRPRSAPRARARRPRRPR